MKTVLLSCTPTTSSQWSRPPDWQAWLWHHMHTQACYIHTLSSSLTDMSRYKYRFAIELLIRLWGRGYLISDLSNIWFSAGRNYCIFCIKRMWFSVHYSHFLIGLQQFVMCCFTWKCATNTPATEAYCRSWTCHMKNSTPGLCFMSTSCPSQLPCLSVCHIEMC